jgi:hypothetical protein
MGAFQPLAGYKQISHTQAKVDGQIGEIATNIPGSALPARHSIKLSALQLLTDRDCSPTPPIQSLGRLSNAQFWVIGTYWLQAAVTCLGPGPVKYQIGDFGY